MSITGLKNRIGPYDRGVFRADVIAGVTVSALVIPKALGYAGIALVPIEYGLYAAAVGAVLYALLGSSRQISTGPSSALAAVAAAAVVTSGVPTEDAPAVVAAVTTCCVAVRVGTCWMVARVRTRRTTRVRPVV